MLEKTFPTAKAEQKVEDVDKLVCHEVFWK